MINLCYISIQGTRWPWRKWYQ